VRAPNLRRMEVGEMQGGRETKAGAR
jgi:hypothetical protein